MNAYLKSRLVRIGGCLIVGGALPLLLIIAAATLGLTSDPNPNPIGPGLLVFVTFWPGMICLMTGVIRVWFAQRSSEKARQEPGSSSTKPI
jgi:hypothetical protein